MFTAGDAQHPHLFVVAKTREQFWRNEEVLAGVLVTGDFYHPLMYHPLVSRVHTLIDLVDDPERSLRHGLQ